MHPPLGMRYATRNVFPCRRVQRNSFHATTTGIVPDTEKFSLGFTQEVASCRSCDHPLNPQKPCCVTSRGTRLLSPTISAFTNTRWQSQLRPFTFFPFPAHTPSKIKRTQNQSCILTHLNVGFQRGKQQGHTGHQHVPFSKHIFLPSRPAYLSAQVAGRPSSCSTNRSTNRSAHPNRNKPIGDYPRTKQQKTASSGQLCEELLWKRFFTAWGCFPQQSSSVSASAGRERLGYSS